MTIKQRLIQVLVSILLIFLAGSVGYYALFGGRQKFIDCAYMTVISLTGVGYGEVIQITEHPAAQIFTMILIIFGMGIILYGISVLTALMIEGELSGMMRRRAMERNIGKLSGHYIVCGGGETGRPLIEELMKNRETVMPIEHDPENLAICARLAGLYPIQGDAPTTRISSRRASNRPPG